MAATRPRQIVRDIRVTFAHGQKLRCVMQLSIQTLEAMTARGEFDPDSVTCVDCGDHVTLCPELSPLLRDFPQPSWLAELDAHMAAAE